MSSDSKANLKYIIVKNVFKIFGTLFKTKIITRKQNYGLSL